MTDKITLTNLVNLQNETTAVSAINNNNAAIVAAIDNTLSRDGTIPNQMGATIDMNNHQLYNLPAPLTGQSPLRLTDLSSFIGGGTIANMPAGGSVGQVLTKRTAVDFDVDWENIEHTGFDPRAYGAKGDGVTDDSTAITNCITAAVAAGGTMILTDGNYKHASTLNWAWNKFRVIALGANVKFTHSGSGVAHQFSGIINYPASQGAADGVFGGPNAIIIVGNAASTTNAVLIDNWHFGEMNVCFGGGASNAFMLFQDTGIVNASSVTCTYKINISTNVLGVAYTATPWYGIRATKLAGCYFIRPVVEFCGNVSQGTPAVSLVSCIGNTFVGGTVESSLCGGVSLSAGCHRNVFIGLDVEVNGAAQDWIMSGNNNAIINCSGGGTTSGQFLAGNNNQYINCSLQSAVVQVGATENYFNNCQYSTAFSDLGTRTTVISPDSIATARDTSTSIFSNKIINTANANTITLGNASPSLTGQLGFNAGLVNWYDGASIRSAVASDTTQTLTNKTIAGAANTLSVRIANDVTGLGTNVATFLATPSSSNLAAALTDEDGTGVVPFELTGTWTPTDQSGASLVFTSVNCRYTKIGNVVHAYGTFTMPTTASGAAMTIGGLPFTVPNTTYAAIPSPITNTVGVNTGLARTVVNTTNFVIFKNSTATNAINSDFTGSVMTFCIIYPFS